MVKSMFAAIAGLKAHQTKMDVLSNNIANVNTWGYKSKTTNFSDAMYQNMVSGSAGETATGSSGGKNASQLGFGSNVSSIVADYTTGSWNPTGNGWNCMINGPSFFIVGPMSAGNIDPDGFAESGASLSRVGIFQIDSNGYLVNDTGNYVYGFELVDGTGTPEIPAVKETITVEGATVQVEKDDATGTYNVTIGGITVKGIDSENPNERIKQWAEIAMRGQSTPDDGRIEDNGAGDVNKFKGYTIAYEGYEDNVNPDDGMPVEGTPYTVNLSVRAKSAGVLSPDFNDQDPNRTLKIENPGDLFKTPGGENAAKVSTPGENRIAAKEARYNDMLTPIRLPQNVDSFNSFTIGADGTIVGIDDKARPHTIGKIAVATVANPNGLEQTEGYLYSIGPNAGTISIQPAGSDAVGKILSGYLEMSNVDLATEMSTMITTQRGYQANTKIISVTDQMLEELVNIKR